MNDMNELMRHVFRSAMLVMSGCLLVWAFFPGLKPYAAGLILGIAVSLVNARILGHKIHQMTEGALANNGKRVGSGYVARISMVLIGTMVSVKFPQFDLISTIIGFFFVQLAAFFLGFFLKERLQKGKR
jgi:ATP synthase protein I